MNYEFTFECIFCTVLHQNTCIVSEISHLMNLTRFDEFRHLNAHCPEIIIGILYRRPDICMHFYIYLWWEPMGIHLPSTSKDLYYIGDLKFVTLLCTLCEYSRLNNDSPLHHNCRIVSESSYLYAFLHGLWSETIWTQHPSGMGAYGNTTPLCIKRPVLYQRSHMW